MYFYQSADGISEVMDLMETYCMKKNDWDTLQKFSQFSGRPDRCAQIPYKVKENHVDGGREGSLAMLATC